MQIVWDERKRQSNLAKHGLDFADLDAYFSASATLLPAHTGRRRAIGWMNGVLVVSVVFQSLEARRFRSSAFAPRPGMRDCAMSKDFDPAHAAAHGYTKADWDEVSDNPEWTDDDSARAKPFSEEIPELYGSIIETLRKRGPVRTKTPISIRLDDDLVDRLRASGPGWQSRVNDALRRWIDDAA